MSSDPLLIVTVFMLLMTMGMALLYYRRIKRTQEEYDDAKGVVENIIISFNKQLQKEEDKLNTVAHIVKGNYSKSEGILKKVEVHDKKMVNLEAKIEGVSEIERTMLIRLKAVDKRIEDTIKMQEIMIQKNAEFEKQKFPVMPKAEIEAVIPIRKEKALSPLTETELRVIETLAADGEKTAPEIKERIELSREHTARLMKKLYENGYLERNTRKTPYIYRLKKEMLKILGR